MSTLTTTDAIIPNPIVIKVKTNKALKFKNKDGTEFEFRDDLTKTDIDSVTLDGIDLKDSTNLTTKLKDVSGLKIQAFSTSRLNKPKDDENFRSKTDAVVDYVTTNAQNLIQADKDLIDLFFSKNKTKYGNFDKSLDKNKNKRILTADIILERPQDIEYLTKNTGTSIVTERTLIKESTYIPSITTPNVGLSGAEEDANDLLKFLTAVVESRKTFDDTLTKLKINKPDKSTNPTFNKLINFVRKGNVGDGRYKYYTDANIKGIEITEKYIEVGLTKYVGINPANADVVAAAAKDPKNFTAIITKFASEFDSNIRQILITPEKTGGKKSRKTSKGGQKRRKTRSSKKFNL